MCVEICVFVQKITTKPLHMTMPHVNSGGTDDFYSSDEVKVYNEEGEEENEKRSSENLSEDKLGLVTETEEV